MRRFMSTNKLTTEEFVKRATDTHGNKFDYSHFEYEGYRQKIRLLCTVHGEFTQSVENHLLGRECKWCAYQNGAKDRTIFKDKFLQDAKIKYRDRYSYNLMDYKSFQKAVTITCNLHGNFRQSPKDHLVAEGCKHCRGIVHNAETFTNKANIIHNNKYSYHLVRYKNNTKKVVIVCPVHGEFLQIPANHLCGSGCPSCSMEVRVKNCTKPQEDFISEAKKIYGDKYTYERVNYISGHDYVEVTCRIHGVFKRMAVNLLRGSGCSYCLKVSGTTPSTLYIVNHQDVTKVGISREVSKRLATIRWESGREFKLVKTYQFSMHNTARSVECDILKFLKENYIQAKVDFAGHTECFEDVNLADLLNKIELLIKENLDA
jgi:hypothetical protein